jgi:hypothetical protein
MGGSDFDSIVPPPPKIGNITMARSKFIRCKCNEIYLATIVKRNEKGQLVYSLRRGKEKAIDPHVVDFHGLKEGSYVVYQGAGKSYCSKEVFEKCYSVVDG